MQCKKIKPDTIDLSAFSHIRIGSLCHNFFKPAGIDELIDCYEFAYRHNLKILPLAGGSNILFGNTDGLAVISDLYLPHFWKKHDNDIIVSGNFNITRLLMDMARQNLGGLEFLAAIPAHLAGLVVMNAGAFGKQISDYVKSVTVLTKTGVLKTIHVSDIKFEYRKSSITDFITQITISPLVMPEKEVILSIRNTIEARRTKQPLNMPNLGSIFKNPPDTSAGLLLDKLGYKGKRFGDAAFWEQHANIMVNLGNATYKDAITLINSARQEVIDKYSLELIPEIKVINS